MFFLYQKPPHVKLLLFSITFCQKIQTSVSVPGNVISQRLHCVSVHGYLTSISCHWWSPISFVVVTTAWVVLSISKTLMYSLYLCLIWHGCVVLCCIFMEAFRYVNHSPIILSIGPLTFLYCIPFSGVTARIIHLHNGSNLSLWVTVVLPLPRASHITGGNPYRCFDRSCSKSFTQVLPHEKW